MARLGDHRPALTIDRFALRRAIDEGAAAASLCETLADSEAFELQCIRTCAKTGLLYTTTTVVSSPEVNRSVMESYAMFTGSQLGSR